MTTRNFHILTVLTLMPFVVSCTMPPSSTGFNQRGYLKHAGNHIRTITYAPSKTPEEIRAHAEKLHYTKGKMAAAYYYPEGSPAPADGVTLAPGITEANDVIYNAAAAKWRYTFMRSFDGTIQFIDCALNPSHDLCPSD